MAASPAISGRTTRWEGTNMTNEAILRIAMQQSAVDSSCCPEDFLQAQNILVISRKNDRARKYLDLPFACDLTT